MVSLSSGLRASQAPCTPADLLQDFDLAKVPAHAARGDDHRAYPWGNDEGNEFFMNAAGSEWKRWMASHDLGEPQLLLGYVRHLLPHRRTR